MKKTQSVIQRVAVLAALAIALLCVPAQAKTKYKMPYYITVDLTNQIVTVYNTADDSIARQMICSTGMQDTTPRGTYYLPKTEAGERENWYYFSEYNCYAQYGTRIIDNVLFHSIPCTYKSQKAVSKKGIEQLGEPASHGCIRMLWPDAKYIAEQCAPGTRVEIMKTRKVNEDLRQLLKQESYDGSQDYKAYLALVDNTQEQGNLLGLTSKGGAVRDLQCRLRDLGIYNGEITGEYHGDTVNAVRFAQRLMGVEATGMADEAFQTQIFSDSAPVAFNVALSDGINGPAVRKLQQRLADLRVYEGPIDSIYDLEVSEALKRFQAAYGFEISDVAAVEVQKALAYEVERLHDIFDPLGGYSFDMQQEKVKFGCVAAPSGIRIRSKPGTNGDMLGHVDDKALVLLMEKGGEWSLIRHGKLEGYVKNDYVHFYNAQNTVLTYTSLDGYASYRIGRSQAEYLAGELSMAELNDLDAQGEEATAIVNTGIEDRMLNLRTAPTPEGAVLGMLPNGTQVRLVLDVGDWYLVDYSGTRGYLMKQYTTLPKQEDGGEVVGQELRTVLAMVKPRYGSKAQIYDSDSDDAEVLGSLKGGLHVDVVESKEDGWCHIRYKGHDGYMRDEDMLFLNGV